MRCGSTFLTGLLAQCVLCVQWRLMLCALCALEADAALFDTELCDVACFEQSVEDGVGSVDELSLTAVLSEVNYSVVALG